MGWESAEVFRLEGDPKANTAYAWLHDTGDPIGLLSALLRSISRQ